jgi:hypothetical protein
VLRSFGLDFAAGRSTDSAATRRVLLLELVVVRGSGLEFAHGQLAMRHFKT